MLQALKFKVGKRGEPQRGPRTGRMKTIRELLYHKEKGELPPGNYFTMDDYLVLDEGCDPQVKVKTEPEDKPKVITLDTKQTVKTEVKSKMVAKPFITSKTLVKPAKPALGSQAAKAVSSQSAKCSFGNSQLASGGVTVTMSKTNNQEAPPEGGSTIILPDGTTIRMSAQQAFNITSTINVPGQPLDQDEDGYYDYDDWMTHMACDECGELLELEQVGYICHTHCVTHCVTHAVTLSVIHCVTHSVTFCHR